MQFYAKNYGQNHLRRLVPLVRVKGAVREERKKGASCTSPATLAKPKPNRVHQKTALKKAVSFYAFFINRINST